MVAATSHGECVLVSHLPAELIGTQLFEVHLPEPGSRALAIVGEKTRRDGQVLKTECPRQTLRPDGGKTGDGSAPRSLSRTGIRRALAGLPASRRCSPRQAEFSASQQGRPAPCGDWNSSEAFQLAWADGCATGPRTRSRHDCVYGPRLNHLAQGQPPLLAVRLPRATGLAS